MARIEGYTEDDLAAIEADFANVVQASMVKVCLQTAEQLRGPVVAAGVESASLGPEDIAVVTQLWDEEVDGVLAPYIAEVYTGAAVQVAVGTGHAFPNPGAPGIPLLPDDYALTYLKSVKSPLGAGGDALWEDIRTEMLDGVQKGQSIDQIAARIKAVSQYTQVESTRIARTQVHAAAEIGSISQVKFMGYTDDEVDKEWVATLGDGRTRATHIAAHGQKVPLHAKFLVGGEKLDCPGDPSGSPAEVEQCRCTTVFNFDKPPTTRCSANVVVAAGATATATTCIVPTTVPDISHLQYTPPGAHIPFAGLIFNQFMKGNITPAYGGAKIQKVLVETRAALTAAGHDMSGVSDLEMLAAIDQYYVAKKDTFFAKYTQWAQSPAGQKALGSSVPKPIKAVKAPLTSTSPAGAPPPPSVVPPALPAIPGKPNPSDLVFTGKTFSSASGAQVWVDPTTGHKWLFKPVSKSGSYTNKFLLKIETALSRLQSKAKLTRPAIYEIDLNGQQGTVQYMFPSTEAFPGGSFNPLKLSDEDLFVMQREQIFDWLVSNHDTHSGQWIRLSDGQLLGIDKGQAFKFFPNDVLSWDYVPVTPLGSDKLTYTAMWKAFVQGKDIKLQDPTTGELGAYLDRLMAVSDAEYKALMRPYAELRVQQFGGDAEKLLAQMVARKNSLKQDFAAFYAKALAERAKHLPAPTPTVSPTSILGQYQAAQAAPTPVVGTASSLGDISAYNVTAKKNIFHVFTAASGGKKVTPAWGGAKVYKLIVDILPDVNQALTNAGLPPMTQLQLLRVLDDWGGFKGKPKTYESVVVDWLKSPQSTKTTLQVGLPDQSLKQLYATPVVQSVTATPTVTTGGLGDFIHAQATLANPLDTNNSGSMLIEAAKYNDGDVIAYMTDAVTGTTYRVAKMSKPGMVSMEWWDETAKKWKFTGFYDNPLDINVELGLPSTQKAWAMVHPANTINVMSSAPVVPPSVGKTLIPGKAPLDAVTIDEIKGSLYLWGDGDVIATTKAGTIPYRLVSDGKGGMKLEGQQSKTGAWVQIDSYTPTSAKFFTKKTINDQWQLTGDVIKSTQTSPMGAGYLAGDTVTPQQIIANAGKPDTTYAYAIDGNGILHRMRTQPNGALHVETRSASGSWTVTTTKVEPSGTYVMQHVSKYKWVAAKADGSIPDQILAVMPGSKGVPGLVQPSLIPGKAAGDAVYKQDMWQAMQTAKSGDVVATTKTFGNKDVRLVMRDDGYLHVEIYDTQIKKWVDHGPIYVQDDIPAFKGWNADYTTAPPTTAKPGPGAIVYSHPPSASGPPPTKAAKAAKKAAAKAAAKAAPPGPAPKVTLTGTSTHIPGKSVGDVVDKDEMLKAAPQYVDGTIIATGKYTYWGGTEEWRLVAYDGKLISQKKTKAGAWKSEGIITDQKYSSLPYLGYGQSAGKWIASNDTVTKPQLTAIKNFHAKKTSPPPPKTYGSYGGSGYGATKKSTPHPVVQFTMSQVDLTPWTDTEREAIFQYFKSHSGTYTGSSQQQIWAALQATKSHYQTQGGKNLQLNEIEILRIIDERSAIKHGVTDTHPFEAKIVNWLNTPAGKAWVNKKIDAPIAAIDVPVPMEDFAAGPPGDKQTYKVISTTEAKTFREESHAKYGGWTQEQRSALKTYTGGSYSSWNAAIRSGDISHYEKQIKAEQRAMRPSTRPMLLHRGTSFAEFNDPSISSYETLLPYVGRTYTTRGFTSSSVGGKAAFSGELLLEIEAPIGTPMAYVKDISQFPGENETTLATHLIYEIMSVTKKPGSHTTIMRVRIIGVAVP